MPIWRKGDDGLHGEREAADGRKKALGRLNTGKASFGANGAPAERNLEPKLLTEAFAEMERWSEELRHDPTLAEALKSLEGDRKKSASRARRSPSQMRGPSR